jgi:hypothetical protein
MGLELISEADQVLNACGRLQAPPGMKFIDLPRSIGVQVAGTPPIEGGTFPGPFAVHIENRANTLFLIDSLGVASTVGASNLIPFRIKWPNGRYLQQNISQPQFGGPISWPSGLGSNALAFNSPQPIEAGGRITIEIPGGVAGTLNLNFWGRVRYLLKQTNGRGGSAAAGGAVSCIIGYPAGAGGISGQNVPITYVDDPRELLARMARYCGPNGNILAPEFLLGNQCTAEVPAGYSDEPHTFFSPPITCAINKTNYGNPILVPGNYDVVVRRIRALSTYPDDGTTGNVVFSLRMPNGYSMMGGDKVPLVGLFEWLPVFPTLWVRAGDRIILDVSNINGAGSSISTTFEFDAAKRRLDNA